MSALFVPLYRLPFFLRVFIFYLYHWFLAVWLLGTLLCFKWLFCLVCIGLLRFVGYVVFIIFRNVLSIFFSFSRAIERTNGAITLQIFLPPLFFLRLITRFFTLSTFKFLSPFIYNNFLNIIIWYFHPPSLYFLGLFHWLIFFFCLFAWLIFCDQLPNCVAAHFCVLGFNFFSRCHCRYSWMTWIPLGLSEVVLKCHQCWFRITFSLGLIYPVAGTVLFWGLWFTVCHRVFPLKLVGTGTISSSAWDLGIFWPTAFQCCFAQLYLAFSHTCGDMFSATDWRGSLFTFLEIFHSPPVLLPQNYSCLSLLKYFSQFWLGSPSLHSSLGTASRQKT